MLGRENLLTGIMIPSLLPKRPKLMAKVYDLETEISYSNRRTHTNKMKSFLPGSKDLLLRLSMLSERPMLAIQAVFVLPLPLLWPVL